MKATKKKPAKRTGRPITLGVGDRVTWRSQAGGYWVSKLGSVVEVVPAKRVPNKYASTGTRPHESYVVEVIVASKGKRPKKSTTCWPLVSALTRVRKAKPAQTITNGNDFPIAKVAADDPRLDRTPSNMPVANDPPPDHVDEPKPCSDRACERHYHESGMHMSRHLDEAGNEVVETATSDDLDLESGVQSASASAGIGVGASCPGGPPVVEDEELHPFAGMEN